MRIMIFSGTTEGRLLSRLLAEKGADVTVCVATEYGCEEQGEAPGITVLTGRKTVEEMVELLGGSDLCVDATHPYAVEVTKSVRRACGEAGVPYRRLLRDRSADTDAIAVDSAEAAAKLLADREGNILLATGMKELPAFAGISPARLYPRVLPTGDSIAACERAGIPHRNIIAMQGPFSRELNEALIRQFNIAFLVTKDGGKAGGFQEKVQAAENTGVRMLLIRRPEETGETFEDVVRSCEEMMKCL
ncbi:precorrin-6A reductase [Oscillibacter sp.]|uniref:precorrin-6A reductase n=1 Tax=Oscillibacter sp. TaxID=1945593 RepID=UPI001B482B56|nr:precorrin-6A reductase [Oscillibacter sp.]MBP3510193.1 precorrin-6A reductase [Oscillibacter sp.]